MIQEYVVITKPSLSEQKELAVLDILVKEIEAELAADMRRDIRSSDNVVLIMEKNTKLKRQRIGVRVIRDEKALYLPFFSIKWTERLARKNDLIAALCDPEAHEENLDAHHRDRPREEGRYCGP